MHVDMHHLITAQRREDSSEASLEFQPGDVENDEFGMLERFGGVGRGDPEGRKPVPTRDEVVRIAADLDAARAADALYDGGAVGPVKEGDLVPGEREAGCDQMPRLKPELPRTDAPCADRHAISTIPGLKPARGSTE